MTGAWGIFVSEKRYLFGLKREMAVFFLVKRDLLSSFAMIITRKARTVCL